MRFSPFALALIVGSSPASAELLDAKALRALSDASPPAKDENIVILREEIDVVVNDGVWSSVERYVFRIDGADAIDSWGHVSYEYAPWSDERPVIAARVLAPDGRLHALDEKTLTESVVGRDKDIYTDRRRLEGPLPAMQKGSVVEMVTTGRSRADSTMSFESRSFTFGGPRTIASFLRVDAPAASTVRSGGLNAPKPVVEKRDGRQVWTWSRGELAARPRSEPWAEPAATVPYGLVRVSVDATWSDVATAYAKIVGDALQGFNGAQALQRDLSLSAAELRRAPRDARIQRILDAVGKRVRYTGLELSDAAIVPRAPGVTLERRFGDCKDLSLLVVALLRAVGVDADVALVSTRALPVFDVPAMATFDHAIVHVGKSGGDKELWLDATITGLRVGEIGTSIERRSALIGSKRSRALVTLPPTHGTYTEEREIKLASSGPATIVEVSRATGAAAIDRRWGFTDEDAAARKKQSADWAKQAWAVDEKDEVVVELGADLADVTVRGRGRIGATSLTEAFAYVKIGALFERLPYPLHADLDDENAPMPRRGSLEGVMTSESTLIARVVPPAGFRAQPLPELASWRVGAVSFTQAGRVLPDGVVEIKVVVRQEQLRVEPADVDDIRKKIAGIMSSNATLISFVSPARALRDAGDHKGAVRLALRDVAKAPKDAGAQARLADELLAAKLIDAGRAAAERAVALAPDDVQGWRLLASASERNAVGVVRATGADLSRARIAYHKVLALDATNEDRVAHANALLHEPGGAMASDVARAQEALAVVRAVPVTERTDAATVALVKAAAISGQLTVLADVIPDPSPYGTARNLFFSKGVEAGLAEAKAKLSAPERERLLDFVGATLLYARRYQDLNRLLQARGRVTLGAKMGRCPASLAPPGSKRGVDVVRAALLEIVRPDTSVEAVRKRYATATSTRARRPLTLDTERTSITAALVNENLPGLFTCDVLVDGMQLAVVLDHARGEVVRLEVRAGDSVTQTTYVVLHEGSETKLFELEQGSLGRLGDAALAALAKNDRVSAQFFVDAAGKILNAAPLIPAPADADLETRAALLALDGASAAPAVRVLTKAAMGGAPVVPVTRLREVALVRLLVNDERALATEQLEQLTGENAALATGVGLELGRLDIVEKWLASMPASTDQKRTRSRLLIKQGKIAEGVRIEDELLADASVSNAALRGSLLNEKAWRSVLQNDAGALELARRARQMNPSPAIEHTLACAAAAAGRPDETIEALRRMAGPLGQLDGNGIYAIARLAEELGHAEEARRLYERAVTMLPPSKSTDSSRSLVDAGLARLRKRS